ncbi:MAG: sce7726 family protein [Actinomycetota bacterium]
MWCRRRPYGRLAGVSVAPPILERMFGAASCSDLAKECAGPHDSFTHVRELRWLALPPPRLGRPVEATEAIVRDRLRAEIVASAKTPSETIYEFWVPRSNERADVVVVGGHMSAFEIKTERDTLKRLPRQATAYARLFDRCTIVLAERHVAAAMEMLPEWWGIVTIVTDEGQPSFRSVRSATPNHGVDPETLVRLLWREEVRAVLAALGHEPDAQASRSSMWGHLISLVDVDRLKEVVRRAILARDPGLARIPTRRFCTVDVSG